MGCLDLKGRRVGGWFEREREREASHTGEPGLGNILTARALGRLTFLH